MFGSAWTWLRGHGLPWLLRDFRGRLNAAALASTIFLAVGVMQHAGDGFAPSSADAAPAPAQVGHRIAADARPRLDLRPPYIVTPRRRLQCVPYARELSGVQIRGDAWTWWGKAKGRYRRGARPAVGSVIVLKRRCRSRGHLAVVTHILNSREIVASHANWLNNGRIHKNTPIKDVSRTNDWSAVRVWHTPTHSWGRSVYRPYGFIYPGTTAGLGHSDLG